jgi:hypothetical protein
MWRNGIFGEIIFIGKETGSLRRKPAPVLLCPPSPNKAPH